MSTLKRRTIRVFMILAAFMLVLGLAQTSQAALSQVSRTADGVTVLVDPVNGYPIWYQDGNGVAVEQCNFLGAQRATQDPDFDPLCIPGGPADPDPSLPGVDFEEAFWWSAAASITNVNQGVDGFVEFAVEAAFAGGPPVAGDQIVFARTRIRIDVQRVGTYTVTHPYGAKTFNVTAVGPGLEINDTVDFGGGAGDFVRVLATSIGPLLRCQCTDPLDLRCPAGYLGDFRRLCGGAGSQVVGSPTGNNVFRITGPGVNVTTNRFNISGKRFTGANPTPLTVVSTTYSRTSAGGSVEVAAISTPNAVVTVVGVRATPVRLIGDGTGNFFVSIPIAAAQALPATVTVRANTPNTTLTALQSNLVDIVRITTAEFDGGARTLTVSATSSDAGATPPTLTAVGFGNLVNGTRTFPNVTFPPTSVTVTSSAGGTATSNVTVVGFASFSIRGIVRNPDGTPVAGATISLTGAATRTATTTATGRYIFRNLPNGDYTVTPSMTGFTFTPVRRLVTISGANRTGVNFTRNSAATGFTISGLVTDAAGAGLPGVTITLSGAGTGTATTNATGRYAFRNQADGTYTLTPSLAGSTFTPVSRTVTVAGANRRVAAFRSN